MRTSKPVTVTLGAQQKFLDARLASGEYASASEVLRSALRALEREETLLDTVMRARVAEALADDRARLPAEDVLARMAARHHGTPGRGS